MAEQSNPTHDVFLSYSSKDKNWADAACAVLERHRVRCWIAPRDITPGDEWGAAIIKGINGSRIMVLIFSGHANASAQVRREVERAISRGMSVLPIRIENVLPEGAMEYALGNMHWLDAFTPPMERQLELLARSVKTLLGKDVESVAARAPAQPAAVAPAKLPEGLRATGDEPARTKARPRTEPNRDSRVEFQETESSNDANPDVASAPRRLRARWPIAIAASLFGLVVLGAIMMTILRPANRIPPAGPARRATGGPHGSWSVEDDQLIKEGLEHAWIFFGDQAWTDYDFTFEARKSAGTDGFGASFRGSGGKAYGLVGGGLDKKHVLSFDNREIRSKPGTIQLREWYKVKISLRGPRIHIELDDHVLFDLTDEHNQHGRVALHCWNAAAVFRNIKVSAPDGTPLWEGPPDLPEK
jgi:hypothetical protein